MLQSATISASASASASPSHPQWFSDFPPFIALSRDRKFLCSNPRNLHAMAKARKIAVVGSRSVGKSSMTVRFVEDHFVESYYPTIENQFSKTIEFKNQEYAIEILDTAGQDEFSMMSEKHLIGVHGYLLVYSVTSRQSFEMVEVIRDKILNAIGNDNIPLVLVGNKSDLEYQRQVDHADGVKLAERFGCPFMESSVKENINVNSVFETLIDRVESVQNPKSKPEEKCVIM
ncbi:GTP-binding protein [Meyerozyma sp. JA9]|nr:GTP-binding protein [Meyerozyma sp. JA9]